MGIATPVPWVVGVFVFDLAAWTILTKVSVKFAAWRPAFGGLTWVVVSLFLVQKQVQLGGQWLSPSGGQTVVLLLAGTVGAALGCVGAYRRTDTRGTYHPPES